MRILGIETSCDETAVCLLEADGDFGADFKSRILGNALASQAAKHAEYGGVFPNLAKREHQKNLVPILELALKEAGELKDAKVSVPEKELIALLEQNIELGTFLIPFLKTHAAPKIDAIAVTYGPGLEPALWVGVNFARALSSVWNVPIVAVNHMEGHIMISMIDLRGQSLRKLAEFDFPAIALLISGGHTELVLMKKWMQYEIIGKTRDDAVGEAFDKVARMLGLPYPGGPHVSRLAKEARDAKLEAGPKLPRPMMDSDDLDFSFSGLKTAVLRIVEEHAPVSDELKKRICREFEDAAAEVLVEKTLRAVDTHSASTVVVGGGVSANKHIKAVLKERLGKKGIQFLVSKPEFATDNAVMIALAGYFHALKKEFTEHDSLRANGSLVLGQKS